MSNIQDLSIRAEEIRRKYEELNAKQAKDAWGIKDYAMGFVGDVGDLMKLVMAKENIQSIEDHDEKLARELADCLWSVLIIANHYDIDLSQSFEKTMAQLQQKITGEIV